MTSARKLQGEVDRVLKTIGELVGEFNETFNKMPSLPSQKDKSELELKKKVKKLKKHRDQLKIWISNTDIKNKKPLQDARKTIETTMEQYKTLERESKGRGRDGGHGRRNSDSDEDGKEGKDSLLQWMDEAVASLNDQKEEAENEKEQLNRAASSTNKKKKGAAAHHERQDELTTRIERLGYHIGQLTSMREKFDNDEISAEQVESIKEDVQNYVEKNGEEGFEEDENIYDNIDLEGGENNEDDEDEAEEEREGSGGNDEDDGDPAGGDDDGDSKSANEDDDEWKKKTNTKVDKAKGTAVSSATTSKVTSSPSAPSSSPSKAAAAPSTAATKSPLTQTAAKVVSKLPPTSTSTAAKAAVGAPTTATRPLTTSATAPKTSGPAPSVVNPVPNKPTESLASILSKAEQRGKAGAAGTSSAKASGNSSPSVGPAQSSNNPPPGTSVPAAAVSKPSSDSVESSSSAVSRPPGVGGPIPSQPPGVAPRPNAFPQPAPIAVSGTLQPGGSSSAAPVAPSSPPVPQMPQPPISFGVAGANLGQNAVAAAMSSGTIPMGALEQPQYKDRDRGMLADDYMYTLALLEPSLKNLPDPADTDRPKQYVPRNPFRTPSYFPSVPAPIFDDPALFEKLSVDTLFFIFYFQQGTPHQYLAARELKKSSWRYHKNFLTWFQRHEDPKLSTDEYEQGTYVYFDYESGWCQRIKSDFTFEYRHLEDELQVPLTSTL